jgi:hypothetical protein
MAESGALGPAGGAGRVEEPGVVGCRAAGEGDRLGPAQVVVRAGDRLERRRGVRGQRSGEGVVGETERGGAVVEEGGGLAGVEPGGDRDGDRTRSIDAFSGSWDESVRAETLGGLAVFGQGTPVPDGVEELAARSVFMDVYASFARQHMARWGSTVEQFAAVAAKNHGHSVHNPRAQYRRPFTVEEVLGGRTIAWPLTLPMCSPVSDGAAAALICTPAAANRLGRRRAVRIRASVLGHGGAWTGAEPDEHVSPRTARRLWENVGHAAADVGHRKVERGGGARAGVLHVDDGHRPEGQAPQHELAADAVLPVHRPLHRVAHHDRLDGLGPRAGVVEGLAHRSPRQVGQ